MQLSIIEYLDDTRGPPYLVPRDDPFRKQQVTPLNILKLSYHLSINLLTDSSRIRLHCKWNPASSGIVTVCDNERLQRSHTGANVADRLRVTLFNVWIHWLRQTVWKDRVKLNTLTIKKNGVEASTLIEPWLIHLKS